MSKNARLKSVAEIFGLVAVVASLVFVGIEIQQNTTAVRSATVQAVADQAMQLTLTLTTDEHMPRLIHEMMHNGVTENELTPEDTMRLRMAMNAGFRRHENIYQQVQAGILNRDTLTTVNLRFYGSPFARGHWALVRTEYTPEFAAYWDGLISTE